MEIPFFIRAAIFLIVPIALGLYFAYRRFEMIKQHRLLTHQADKRGGVVNKYWMPAMGFRHGETAISVFPARTPESTRGINEPLTVFKCYSFPLRNLHLQIGSKGVFHGLGETFGLTNGDDIGTQEFNQSYYVKGKDKARLQKLLSVEVQSALLKLNGMAVCLTIDSGTLILQVRRRFNSDQQYDCLIETGILILDRCHSMEKSNSEN